MLTNPLQLLAVSVTQLVLEDSQQVRNDVQSFRQQPNALVHLEVAPDSLVHRFKVRLHPKQLGRVKDGAVEVDTDAQDEELANLHIDLVSR